VVFVPPESPYGNGWELGFNSRHLHLWDYVLEFSELPPSKNQFYFGKAIKSRWIKRFIEKYQRTINKIQSETKQGKWWVVKIEFYLTDDSYVRFEPQNHIESIFDGIFGIYQDHKITKIIVEKHKGDKTYVLIKLSKA